ncbi:hypothetical protein SDC9_84336 [bioreactor metagenome]|uniref:Uncharacterized protein n=1 Tax=bioreactor metagenome TaxID=1076179 RepID=A0A644ZAL6_9ZZZZ
MGVTNNITVAVGQRLQRFERAGIRVRQVEHRAGVHEAAAGERIYVCAGLIHAVDNGIANLERVGFRNQRRKEDAVVVVSVVIRDQFVAPVLAVDCGCNAHTRPVVYEVPADQRVDIAIQIGIRSARYGVQQRKCLRSGNACCELLCQILRVVEPVCG